MTLLKLVQKLLSDINSEPINSLEEDEVEALQIASIVEDCYYEIINTNDKTHLGTLFKLEAGSSSLPTYLQLPENIKKVEWLKYNVKKSEDKADDFKEVHYRDPSEFCFMLDMRTSVKDTVDVITTPEGVTLNIMNNCHPSFFTSFNDSVVVFDSYDSSIEVALIADKTKGYGYREPEFIIADDFVPELPAEMFPLLLAKARSIVFNDIAQAPNAKAEQRERQTRHYMGVEGWRVKKRNWKNDYGRK